MRIITCQSSENSFISKKISEKLWFNCSEKLNIGREFQCWWREREGGEGRGANLLFQLQVFGLEGDLSGEMSV